MTIYILSSEYGEILGAYPSLEIAEKEKKSAYAGGYFGELKITESEL